MVLENYYTPPQKRMGLRSDPLLYCGSALLSRAQELPPLLAAIEQLSELPTAFGAKDYLFAHARVVAWRGGAILLPGRSRSEKTTLVRTLLDARAANYSDEFAVLDGEGRLHSYPVPLSVREVNNPVSCKTSLESLDIQPGSEPLLQSTPGIFSRQNSFSFKPGRVVF